MLKLNSDGTFALSADDYYYVDGDLVNRTFLHRSTDISSGFGDSKLPICSGDSGGPLFIVTANDELKIAGIISRVNLELGNNIHCSIKYHQYAFFNHEIINWILAQIRY